MDAQSGANATRTDDQHHDAGVALACTPHESDAGVASFHVKATTPAGTSLPCRRRPSHRRKTPRPPESRHRFDVTPEPRILWRLFQRQLRNVPRRQLMASVREIARLVGVSPATASRAMNNHPTVAADVRQRVIEAVNRAGYVS